MADNRTGLRPADIAESFRDRCGDGSVEWVYTPTQTWVLLDAADMLEEFADTPKCEECEAMFNCEDCEAMLDCDECLRADSSQKERKRVDYENAKLRELVRDMYDAVTYGCSDCEFFECHGKPSECSNDGCGYKRIADRMRELGVDV